MFMLNQVLLITGMLSDDCKGDMKQHETIGLYKQSHLEKLLKAKAITETEYKKIIGDE